MLQVGGVDGAAAGCGCSPAGAEVAALLLHRLDGRRSQRAVRSDAVAGGLDADTSSTTCWPGSARRRPAARPGRRRPAGHRPRAGRRRPGRDRAAGGGARRGRRRPLARRAGQRAVVVDGATRVGTPLAAVLAASGVGRVQRPRRRPDHAPATRSSAGSPRPTRAGPRSLAAADAVRRASPLTDLRPLPTGQPPDLVVLSRPWAASTRWSAAWQRAGRAAPGGHRARGDRRRRPARAARARAAACAAPSLHRRDDDPAWPRLAAQLDRRRPGAQRRDGHLPAHRRSPPRCRCSPTSTATRRRRRWTPPSNCARPTSCRGCGGGRRTPTAAAPGAPRQRRRRARPTDGPPGTMAAG